MCEFATFKPENPFLIPTCEYTGQLCTLCVYGNMETYHEAKNASKQDNIEKRGN